MSDLTEKFSGLQAQMTSQHNSIMELLGEMFTTIETLNSNASLNTQKLLAAINAGNCGCDGDAPLFPPEADTTATELSNEALCKRIQYFLDLFRLGYLKNTAAYIFDSGALSQSNLNAILHEAVNDVGLSGSVIDAPLSSSDSTAISSLAGNLIFQLGAVEAAVELSNYSDATDIWTNVQNALWSSPNAAEGWEAAQAQLDGEGFNSTAVTMIKRMFGTAWANIIYSDAPEVDDSAYSGTICSIILPTECYDIEAVYTDLGGYYRYVIYLDAAYVGYIVNVVEPMITVHLYGDGDPGKTIDDTPYQLTTANVNIGLGKFFFSNEYAGYSLTVCPPEA